jgi:hypothetical protein
MTTHEEDIAALERERRHNAVMRGRGFIAAPYGGWIHRREWHAHLRQIRARAERSPQWAP